MGGEIEAAGDVLTGRIVAGTIEDEDTAGVQGAAAGAHGACLNCGATLTGAYCAACGQAAHIHRSLTSLGHDILHGVFHFEGRIWRTLPELFLHPGRLTRRYIDGERAKFVSPMALFLFTVFLMFATFAFTGGALLIESNNAGSVATSNFRTGNAEAIEKTDRKIAVLQEQRAAPDLPPAQRAVLDDRIADLKSSRTVMEALAMGDWARLAELDKQNEQSKEPGGLIQGGDIKLDGWPALEQRLNEGFRHLNDNPSLLLYKLKTNGYKFSWALIPLSVPFLWLLFFWRRDIHLYDHAVFATYSITFMMLLLILLSIGAAVGVAAAIWETALVFAPPIHMYRQLRGAYGLSRFGTFVRLFLLLIAISLVLTLFTLLLLVLGVLG